MTPTVSVIVPNYNQGHYLTDAIKSILRQTWQDITILIVDDGSTDESQEIIDTLVRTHPEKISTLHHPGYKNRGLLQTYQLALSQVQSEYVAFCEADDIWEPDYLRPKIRILQTLPQVGVVFSSYRVTSKGLYGKDMMIRQWILNRFMKRDQPFDNFCALLKRNNIATFSTFVTRKSLLDRITIPPDPDMVYYDWWLLIQLAMQSLFYRDTSSRIQWRHHPQSTLGKQSLDLHIHRLVRFMTFCYDSIERQIDDLDSDGATRAFQRRKRLLPYFTAVYKHPTIRTLSAFFIRDPLWTLETLISYWVNRRKFTTNDRS